MTIKLRKHSSKKTHNKSLRKRQKTIKNKLQKIYVIVYNINYYDTDGNIILNSKKKRDKVLKNYKYNQGTSGEYGFYHEYIIPSDKIKNFNLDIKSFYKKLGIKELKITTSINKNRINTKLYLLDKRKGGTKKTRRGGGRDESVQGELYGWQPGFDHPDQTLPPHVLRNITEHLHAIEANPSNELFLKPPRVFKQTMDEVEEPPPLAYPPLPKLSEEQKNNMIIQQYTSIPDSGKILPMKFIVSENDPRTGTPFKVYYGDAGRIQFLHLKAVGDVPWWDESWLEPKRFHQSYKFPRPAPVIDDARRRIYGPDTPAYDNRRGDILVAIDPSSKRDDKVIAEIGEVIRFPMSCDPHRIYTTHCFKINFNTPKELDFTTGKPDGERRRPYWITLPPQTVIRVIRGRKKDYPPITPRDTFREPPPARPE
jgi:hypothetical protein